MNDDFSPLVGCGICINRLPQDQLIVQDGVKPLCPECAAEYQQRKAADSSTAKAPTPPQTTPKEPISSNNEAEGLRQQLEVARDRIQQLEGALKQTTPQPTQAGVDAVLAVLDEGLTRDRERLIRVDAEISQLQADRAAIVAAIVAAHAILERINGDPRLRGVERSA